MCHPCIPKHSDVHIRGTSLPLRRFGERGGGGGGGGGQ